MLTTFKTVKIIFGDSNLQKIIPEKSWNVIDEELKKPQNLDKENIFIFLYDKRRKRNIEFKVESIDKENNATLSIVGADC